MKTDLQNPPIPAVATMDEIFASDLRASWTVKGGPMPDVGKMVDAILDAVDKPLRAFHERVKTLEQRIKDLEARTPSADRDRDDR